MVRDYVKWDDEPASLGHFAESAVRAYKFGMTPPMGPVVLVVDHDMQERPLPQAGVRIPRLTMTSPPAGETGTVREVGAPLGGGRGSADQRRRALRELRTASSCSWSLRRRCKPRSMAEETA